MHTKFNYNGNLSGAERIKRWIAFITPHAKKVGAKYGLPWKALVVQTGWETGWGRSSLLHEANNIAGIKARHGEPFVTKLTHEYRNGVRVNEYANFRKWDTFQEGLEGYATFFHRFSRYREALNYPNDPYRFITEIRNAGYATSINYITNLHGILDRYMQGNAYQQYTYAFEGNTTPDLIKKGQRGAHVRELQRLLNAYLKENNLVHISEDGIFGTSTKKLLSAITGKNEITLPELKEKLK